MSTNFFAKEVTLILILNQADITDIVTSVKLKATLNNGASVLTFDYPTAKSKGFPNGSEAVFTYNNTNIFYGFLFKSSQSKDNFSCICYDQLRYLKASNSIMRQVQTLDSFTNDVCAQVGERMRLGKLDSTEVNLGKYNFDNKTHLDMIYQSIKDNLLLNGYQYVLRDNFGALDLIDAYDLRLPLIIGDSSLATDFEYTNSIDDDTYNYIKVALDDEEKGVRDVYITTQGQTVAAWGKLMLYDKVSAKMNSAQLTERANMLLKIKNRETETLSVECIGDVRVMAGSGIKIEIAQANINGWGMVESVTHEFGKTNHTMKLNLLFGR